MIEKMKKIVIVSPSARKAEMLNAVRDFGLVHISQKSAPESKYTEKLSSLDKIRSVLNEQPKESKAKQNPVLGKKEFEELNERLSRAVASIKPLEDELFALNNEKAKLAFWGSLDPAEVASLAAQGIELSFYQLSTKELAGLPQEVKYISLSEAGKTKTIAVVGQPLDDSYLSMKLELPARGVGEIDAEISKASYALHEAQSLIASSAAYLSTYDHYILKATDDILYSAVSGGVEQEDSLCCLTGFLPETDLEGFKNLAKENCWAYALADPSDEDEVPTKIRYNKVTQMMEPVFQMLGTTPGYNEYDISMWFLLFFALFFAMIIGDAVYGLLFILVGAVLQIKTKKLTNLNLLVYVMGGATLVWGALTGTWLGSEKAMEIPFLKMLVIPNIANYPEYFGVSADDAQNTVMKFCFMIGTIQLSLACLMNFVRNFKQKSLAFVSDLATLASTVSLYYLILMLVVGANVNVGVVFGIIGTCFVLVVLFGSQEAGQSFGAGIKAGLGGAFTTFLNTISSFGNVMSYIRLFAVGMASLAIAQSFNGMAESMLHGLALPAGILILVIGHGLNIVMGMLSVVVHGMRLNLLEFSGQLGMEWAGIPYEPFKKNA